MRKVSWWFVEFGSNERENLLRAYGEKSFTLGRFTQELEASLADALKVPHVVVTNSGTSALTMALLALGVKPGDELLVPDITWIATAQAGALLGADVIPVDTLGHSPIMDLADLKSKITSKTKVIMPVHYNGRDAHIHEVQKLAMEHGVFVVEDACKAMFSRNRTLSGEGFLGTFGDMGCFSMGMISLTPACFGGFVVTHNLELFERLRVIRLHGVNHTSGEEYTHLASNFKYSDLLASLSLSHLHSRERKMKHLREVYNRYSEGLRDLDFIEMIPVDIESGELPLLNDVRSPIREKVRSYLSGHGIETCNFHPPIHLAPYLKRKGDFPNSTSLAGESFHLPCGPDQPIENVDYCIELLHKFKI